MKRALSTVLVLIMVLSLLPSAVFAAEAGYDDINDHWAKTSIERWSEYGIVTGSNGHFRPNAALTRGQLAKILADLLGLSDEGASNPFTDVDSGAWYAPYVLRCHAAGIMKGSGGRANPNSPITRQEAMVMLCQALNIEPAANADFSAYTDGESVAKWAAPYVAAMTKAGIVSGVKADVLAPAASINRASILTILDKAVVQYVNAPGEYALTDKNGIVLIAAAGDVTLKGSTAADILVAPVAAGRTLTFDGAL